MPNPLASSSLNEFATIPLLTSSAERDLPRRNAPNEANPSRAGIRTFMPEESATLYPDEHGINQVFDVDLDPFCLNPTETNRDPNHRTGIG